MSLRWCPTCGARHRSGRQHCPGDLAATESERHGWQVNVRTPRGVEAYGVLVAPTREGWRARIMTYPNVLWVAPGCRSTAKFLGRSPREAESRAVAFIRQHCLEHGFQVLKDVPRIVPGTIDPEAAAAAIDGKPATRKLRFLPVRFGVGTPTGAGGTGNLSENGLFVITAMPVDAGTEVRLLLDLTQQVLPLHGEVRWMRNEHHVGRAPGMGVLLDAPPQSYLVYVRDLD